MKRLPSTGGKRGRAAEPQPSPNAVLRDEMKQRQALLEMQNGELRKAHADLKISHERLAELYEQAPIGYVTFDARGCIREVNAAAAAMLGTARVRAGGTQFIVHVEKADQRRFLDHLRKVRRAAATVSTDLQLRPRKGASIHVRMTTRRQQGGAGRQSLFLSVLDDVTGQRAAQMALSASEAKFRLLAENTGDVFWFMELEPLRITYVSPAFERIWGIPAAELYTRHEAWEECIHPDDRDAVHAAFQRWIAGESGEFKVHYRMTGRDGRMRWIADRGIVIGRRDGKPHQISGIASDVTDAKEAASVRERLATVVESSSDAIITKNPDGIILSWNAGAENIFGYRADEIVGRSISMLLPPEAEDEEERIVARIRRGEKIAHYETRLRRKDGRDIDVWISISILHDAAGRVLGASAIARDITERKRAEERLRGVLEAAPDGMVVVNRDGIIQLVNSAAEQMFGYKREEMVGRVVEMLVPQPLRRRHVRHREGFMASPRSTMTRSALEFHGLRKDGSEFPVEISLSPLRTEAGILVISAVRDISERRRAEEKFRSLLESAPDAMIIANQRGIIELINAEAERLFGYNRQQLIGQPIEKLVPKRFRRDHAGHRAEYAIDPHTRPMGAGRELYALRKDGTEFPTEISLSPLETGNGVLVISAVRDISERKQAQQVIRASEERLRLFVENTPAAVAMFDRDMRYLVASQRWAETFRLAVHDVRGHSHYDLFPEMPERWKKIHRRCLAGATERCERDEFRRADGSVDWVQWEIHPWRDHRGKIGGIILFSEIINERVEAEEKIRRLNLELEERVAARTAALQSSNQALKRAIEVRDRLENEIIAISDAECKRIAQDLHDDLGQQLAGIWYLSLALQKKLESRSAPEGADAARISGFLGKALALTRSLARGLHPVASEPGGLLAALGELAGRSSELFKIRCSLKCPRRVHVTDSTMATHLYRIAQEAVTNAVKHGAASCIEIALAAAPGRIVLSVNDNGRGMKRKNATHEGLGLRIMNYRAEVLGGTLAFHGRPHGGTSVTCSIPLSTKRVKKEH